MAITLTSLGFKKGERYDQSWEEIVNDNADLANALITALVSGAGYETLLDSVEWEARLAAAEASLSAAMIDIVTLQSGQAAGHIGFTTKAGMDADLAHDANTLAEVTNDADSANNGVYIKLGASGAGSWQKSSFNPIGVLSATVAELQRLLAGGGIERYTGTGTQVPIVVDDTGRIILGVDTTTGHLVGTFAEAPSSTPEWSDLEDLAVPPVEADINHLVLYGQSLAIGAQGTPVISDAQPYSNLTFDGGPRASGASFSPLKALVEDNLVAPDGGTNRGETPCSGAAKYATELAAVENGLATISHVILASTAGWGGTLIDQLKKGTAKYTALMGHISNAKSICDGASDSYACHAMGWIQGENDALDHTAYATYRAALQLLQSDFETDVKVITSQTSSVYCLTYQCSYSVAAFADIALAQLDLAQNNDKFALVTPCYHLPFNADGVHLTALGYLWLGHYFGRAYKQLVRDGKRPNWINPISATARGTALKIRFDVPVRPLVLDSVNLAATTDHGFQVVDGTGTLTLSAFDIENGDTVTITLNRALSGAATVRYAFDFLGTGLIITDGASGNLRDSETAIFTSSGTDYNLWNVAPHFSLPIIQLS